MSTSVSQISMAADDGNILYCYINKDGYVKTRTATKTGYTGNSKIVSTAPASRLCIANGYNNHIELVAINASDGLPYHWWRPQGNQKDFQPTGKMLNAPRSNPNGFEALAIAPGNSKNLQLILIGKDDGMPYLVWQDSGNGHWNNEYGMLNIDTESNPNDFKALAMGAGNGNDYFLQVILIGKNDGMPYLIWQNKNGSWNGTFGKMSIVTSSNPNGFKAIAMARGNDKYLQVVLLGSDDGMPYLLWQNTRGEWHGNYGNLVSGKDNPPSGYTDLAIATYPQDGKIAALDLILIGSEKSGKNVYGLTQSTSGTWYNFENLSEIPTDSMYSVALYAGPNFMLFAAMPESKYSMVIWRWKYRTGSLDKDSANLDTNETI